MTDQLELNVSPIDSELREVRIDEIEPWSADGARSKMKTSMDKLGMISTVQLRLHPRRKKQPYSVIDGSRRLDKLVKQGAETVKALVLIGANNLESAAATLSLNVARSPNHLHEARAIRDMIDEGATLEAIAKATGVPLQTLRKRLALLDAPADFQVLLEERKISASACERVGKMNAAQQGEALALFNEHGKLTSEMLRDLTRAQTKQKIEALDLPFMTPVSTDTAETRRIKHLLNELVQAWQKRGLELDDLIDEVKLAYEVIEALS